MEINKFVEQFALLFEDTEKGLITASSNFREFDEWSSLLGLSLIAMVDEEYNVKLKGEEIRKAVTVDDIFNLVEKKL